MSKRNESHATTHKKGLNTSLMSNVSFAALGISGVKFLIDGAGDKWEVIHQVKGHDFWYLQKVGDDE